jgi:hypothetical protein
MSAESWEKAYQVIALKTDPRRMRHRISETRKAIRQRLADGGLDTTELEAIDSALATLMTLEIEARPEKVSGECRTGVNADGI